MTFNNLLSRDRIGRMCIATSYFAVAKSNMLEKTKEKGKEKIKRLMIFRALYFKNFFCLTPGDNFFSFIRFVEISKNLIRYREKHFTGPLKLKNRSFHAVLFL